MHAISGLDDGQRRGLLGVLRDAKAVGSLSGAQSALGLTESRKSKVPSSFAAGPFARTGASALSSAAGSIQQTLSRPPAGQQAVNSDLIVASSASRTRNELRIRVLSTHGDPHLCGLTEIELFDLTAKRVVLLPQNVIVSNQGRHGVSGPSGI